MIVPAADTGTNSGLITVFGAGGRRYTDRVN
jgi:hypothetical protein